MGCVVTDWLVNWRFGGINTLKFLRVNDIYKLFASLLIYKTLLDQIFLRIKHTILSWSIKFEKVEVSHLRSLKFVVRLKLSSIPTVSNNGCSASFHWFHEVIHWLRSVYLLLFNWLYLDLWLFALNMHFGGRQNWNLFRFFIEKAVCHKNIDSWRLVRNNFLFILNFWKLFDRLCVYSSETLYQFWFF